MGRLQYYSIPIALLLCALSSYGQEVTHSEIHIFIDHNGQETTFRSAYENKTHVYFWATWCAPCVSSLTSVAKDMDKQALSELLVISFDDDPTEAQRFMQKIGYSGDHWVAKRGIHLVAERAFGNARRSLPYMIRLDGITKTYRSIDVPRELSDWRYMLR